MKIFLFLMVLALHVGCGRKKEQKEIKNILVNMFQVGDYRRFQWISSSLFIERDNLYFGSFKNNFYCSDVRTGKIKWVIKTGDQCYFQPLIIDDKVFFSSFDLNFYAVDLKSKEIWRYELPGRTHSRPVFYSGLVIISIGSFGVIALDSNTGKLKWKISQGPTALSTKQPLLFGDTLLVGRLNGTYSAFRAKDAKLIWEKSYKYHILSNTSVNYPIIVFGGYSVEDRTKKFINALNIQTGGEIWRLYIDYNTRYTPLIYNGRVYFGTESSEIVCLNILDGSEVWRTKLEGDGLDTEIVAFCNNLYFGGYHRNFYELNALSGKMRNKSSFNYGIGNPICVKDEIFVGTGDGLLLKVIPTIP